MGKSRSATCVVAYLMKHYDLDPKDALERLRESRPFAEPNPGFMEQLEIYSHMLDAPDQAESDQIYQKWLKERFSGEWWTWERRYRESKL